jgi:FAD/FMN-containing dehydrogenase/Fe-S oxidoreductase
MARLPVLQGSTGPGSGAIDSIARGLAQAIEGEVRFDLHNRMLYATDASLYQVEPLGVVIPASINDAVLAVEFCAKRGLAILPRGGGTSLAGQCTNRAVVIDFSPNCRGLLEVDGAGRTCRVEPGITVDDLNDQIAGTGLFFAPDPATSKQANIGGCIGNNAAGARSIRYGRTSDSVLGVDVCLADGARLSLDEGAAVRDARAADLTRRVLDIVRRHETLIRERFPKTIRRNAGYGLDMILKQLDGGGGDDLSRLNLAPLLCGSEGTLAITLGAQLKLFPRPQSKGLAVLAFSTLDAAIDAVVPILKTSPTAVELLDDTVIDLARENVEYRRYVELMPRPAGDGPLRAVLYVEYFGESPAEISDSFEALRRTAPGIAMQAHVDAAAMLNAWKLRKAGEPLLHGIPGHRKPITFVEDNAIPVENLATFVREMRRIVENHGTRAAFYAHASVGVLHVRPLLDIHEHEDRERMKAIAVATADLAKSLGGVMSGEHGDGRVRTPLLERFYGLELMGAFREIKQAFDPDNLLNPGNIVDLSGQSPRPLDSMVQRLRVEPQAGRPTLIPPGTETYFDYTDQHGLDGAVEMCNGAGVCRKKQGGTMCPSYMATLDERHSTRGRGNALRLAITGQFSSPSPREGAGGWVSEGAWRVSAPRPGTIWSDPATIETLNLCLSCKACKTECPSNVDIARLKAEYTAQRYKTAGRTPIRARLFGAVRTLNKLGSVAPWITNWAARTMLGRAVAQQWMGIDPRRSLPPFARPLAHAWNRGTDSQARATSNGPAVALFADCFTMYNEPGIGLATRRIFEACGYSVLLADAGCCGRAKISTGLLPRAIDEIDATLSRLRPLIADAAIKAILVAEPSCLSAMKDDWLALKLRTPIELRRKLAAKAYLPEDFLDRSWDQHPRRPRFRSPTRPVILHGHCHQKALWGADTSARALRRAAGDVRVLDSGCCGMAGSFGFTRDRYDVSMKIGELMLFPAVRDAGPDACIVAPGTSCRHQILDGTAISAKHPMELLAELIE